MIAGIDEVGRGPWAGPLVVGAVVLGGTEVEGLTDSKALSKKRRESLYHEIINSDAAIGLGWVHADEIDRLGLSQSLVEATKRALDQIIVPYHEIIIDGTVNFLTGTNKGDYVTTLKKADLLIPSVSAASIVAKVARDEYMTRQHALYPEYGFGAHVGYGTAKHRAAIEEYGVTPLHRLSFAPLAKYVGAAPRAVAKQAQNTTTRTMGDRGEEVAAEWLETNGYRIVARNWKTKVCEIDLVAQKDRTLFFVEVKHRKDDYQGGGIAAITPKKLKRMTFAAQIYCQYEQHEDDLRLAVITTTGDTPVVERYIEIE